MSASAARVARIATSLSLAALLVSGCEPSPQTSMELLRAGNPGICTAADVEDTVRRLIYPNGITREGYTIAFADASLEAFDQVVSRATCNAALTIDGPQGSIVERTMIDFVVAPAAQDPSHFIVSGHFAPFTERFENAVAEAETARAEEEGYRRAQETLLATVKPGWLIGRWVPASAGSAACVNGPFDDFGPKGRLMTHDTSGSWSLNGVQLKFVTPDSSGSITIAHAARDEFTTDNADEQGGVFRRCGRDEVQAVQIDNADALADQLEAVANDLEGPTE